MQGHELRNPLAPIASVVEMASPLLEQRSAPLIKVARSAVPTWALLAAVTERFLDQGRQISRAHLGTRPHDRVLRKRGRES
jgi:hypothetical protein